MEKIYFAKVKKEATIPSKDLENAGYDIYACFDEDYIEINSHETKMIPTGICSAISEDYVLLLQERGSTGTKGIAQRCGVIDSGYRNEWFVPITNTTEKTIVILKNGKEYIGETITTFDFYLKGNKEVLNYTIYPYEKAISQALLLPVPKAEIIELTATEIKRISSKRGMGHLGSTGK